MNELIQELAMQANDETGNLFDLNHKELNVFLEKFAELMVRECIKICSDVEADTEMDLSDGALVCMAEIKEHFGVEE